MSKSKQVTALIRLVINAGAAKPAPPVGPALGQAGLNIMSFCKDFNAKTADIKVSAQMNFMKCYRFVPLSCFSQLLLTFFLQEGTPVPVLITAYSDKTFVYVNSQFHRYVKK